MDEDATAKDGNDNPFSVLESLKSKD
jgi:uncharacterized metal-binding protein YceD (DUF177 family)